MSALRGWLASVALALAPALAGCGHDEPPAWLALADGTRSAGASPSPALRIELDGTAAWVDYRLAPEARSAGERPGTWSALRPDGVGFMKSGEELALRFEGGEYRARPGIDNPADLAALAPGDFASVGERLHLCLAPGERPRALTFAVRKERSHGARPVLGGVTGEGFALWPGEAMAFRATVGAQRVLRFYWAAEGLAGRRAARASMRVLQDGLVAAELACEADARGAGRWCRVPLRSASDSTLRFELGGEPVLAAVFAPGIGPAQPPARTTAAPNLILFLADTLRADSLACGGGPAGLAPALDQLAAASRRFPAARAPSTWTLPSQASMLSALYPEQHGATSLGHALAPEIETLPEVLRAHGWRTGAVTDSAFVSRHYGFDQGFEWFEEFRTWDLGVTLRAAQEFLAADDGRPAFLFVQTYRTHMPYRTGPAEDRAPLETLAHELRAGCAAYGGDGSIAPADAGARLFELYREGVRDLDHQFGTWWPAVRARAPTFLVFTSDHGEAFFEHGELGHGGSPWEEKIRIPLLVHGPGLAAGDVPYSASLVDLPATFCALAGVATAPSFGGRNLLALDAARASYSFVRIGEQPMVAVIDGTRKVYAPADPTRMAAGEMRGGTDLGADPEERQDLATSQGWGKELARAQASAIAPLVRALVDPRRVELSAEERAFLNDIGYGGD